MRPSTLSFLIPAYNCEDVIDEAIESALSQSVSFDTEVVVVDDGSTDSTAQRVQAWVDRAPERVRFERHERNRGGAASRNTAAGLARGELLYMLDSDNVLPEGCVASQFELLRSTGLDAVSVGQLHYFEGTTGNVVDGWVQRHLDGRTTVRHLFESDKVPPAHGNYIYTRRLFDAAGGYWEDAGAMDTWSFGLRHLVRGFEIGVDPHSYYFHRLHPPGRDSYWSREERNGSNDSNAIAALRDDLEHLPDDLMQLTLALGADDRFFALVRAGAFRSDGAHFRDIRRLERAEHATLSTLHRLIFLAAGLRARVGSHSSPARRSRHDS
jgi:glycosyltransferase involved in cell wall biosynthesis